MEKHIMITKLIFILSALLLLLTSTPSYSYEYEEMKFELYTPCSGTADFCYPKIMARGYITDFTPEKFQEFVENEFGPYEKIDGLTVCLDSPGGSAMGGMNLGRIFRSYQIATCISDHFWSVRYDGGLKFQAQRY
nr:hypothetical protein [Halomonas socia]